MSFDDIFKAYDVRGRVPEELDETMAQRIGAGFARFTGGPPIAVGWDCRKSSPRLAQRVMDGITGQGVDVVSLGQVTTDTIYYVAGSWDMPGVMVTASHNPKGYNGLKFCLRGASPVGEDSGLADIKRFAESIEDDPDAERGSVTERDPLPGFGDHLLSLVDPSQIAKLRVAVDGGNGMAGAMVPLVFEGLEAELIGLYLEPDGDFPNHHPDPLRPENIQDLLALVDDTGADLGVAFDGDADRAFFVDDQLSPLSGSTTTSIIAHWFLQREQGATIVHNLICSRALPEMVEAQGGHPVRTRVGHSFIKEVMAESGAVFGGEHSGHYYFRDNFRADSGLLAMLVLLQVMSEDGRPLSEIRKEHEPYAQSGEINLTVDDKVAAIARVAEAFGDAEQDVLDGLTVMWPDRWFNIRPSNTEPVLRLNAEAEHEESVAELVKHVIEVVA